MLQFDKNSIKNLKVFLYNSFIHDAIIKIMNYEIGEDKLVMIIYNPNFDTKMEFVFSEIDVFFAVKHKEFGSRETIYGLTLEQDFLYLNKYVPNYDKDIKDYIYLIFKMFSGDEIHVVAEKIGVRILK